MINLTKINGEEFVLNIDLIESVSKTPDTTITLTSGKKLMVLETVEQVVAKIIEYRRKTLMGPTIDSDNDDS